MGRCWSFRGDEELDPILEKWTKQNEKSFHIRQALRQYRALGCKYVEIEKSLNIPKDIEALSNIRVDY